MRLQQPPKMPNMLRKKAGLPTGPKFLPRHEELVSGYGISPPGFLTGQNSETEWIVYYSLSKIYKNPVDPRKPPFFGGWPEWEYQSSELGGYSRALGSAVVDFVVHTGREHLGLRIQTERFHIFTDSRRHAYDALQRADLERNGLRIIDIYDDQLLGDPSGQKAIIAVKRAIGLLEEINPIVSGTGLRASRLKVLQ